MKKFIILVLALVVTFGAIAIADYQGQQKLAFIEEEVAMAKRVLQLRSDLIAHTQKWNSRGYVAGGANPIVLGDYSGTMYEGLTIAEITAGQTTFGSFETWINAGHDDNLEKLTDGETP